jgi:hypothetical protein
MPPHIPLKSVPYKKEIVAPNQHKSMVDTAGIVCIPIGLVAHRRCSFFFNGGLASATASQTSEKGPRLGRLEAIQLSDFSVRNRRLYRRFS